MKAYADTGFLVSLYTKDAKSVVALKRMKSQPLPFAWTWLHDFEFKNAIRLRAFRKEIETHDIESVFKALGEDFNAGIHMIATPEISRISSEAERLSASFSTKLGTRSLDVLHVSHALVLGVKEFLTFDSRQGALAEAAGLKVPKL